MTYFQSNFAIFHEIYNGPIVTNANFENIPQNNETIRTLIFRSRPRPTCVITLLDSFYRQFFRPSHSTVRFRCQNATFQRQSGRWRWRPVTIGCVPGVSIFMATNHNELTITLGQDPKVSPLAFDVRDFSARVGCPLLMFDSWCSATDCLITIFFLQNKKVVCYWECGWFARLTE